MNHRLKVIRRTGMETALSRYLCQSLAFENEWRLGMGFRDLPSPSVLSRGPRSGRKKWWSNPAYLTNLNIKKILHWFHSSSRENFLPFATFPQDLRDVWKNIGCFCMRDNSCRKSFWRLQLSMCWTKKKKTSEWLKNRFSKITAKQIFSKERTKRFRKSKIGEVKSAITSVQLKTSQNVALYSSSSVASHPTSSASSLRYSAISFTESFKRLRRMILTYLRKGFGKEWTAIYSKGIRQRYEIRDGSCC